MESMRGVIETSVLGIEMLAVAVILFAVAHGAVRFVRNVATDLGSAYQAYKVHLGKAMLLGLEFMVAADIIETVAVDRTLTGAAMLAILVVVRTFLSWALVVELEGHWPWREPAADRG
jgi:uncharacterized membrane protein